MSLPPVATGKETMVHLRRPAGWDRLSVEDGALLDVMRIGGSESGSTNAQPIQHVLAPLGENGQFARLVAVASTEPPRVRAILGSLGEALGVDDALLRALHAAVQPLSRF